MSELGTIHNFPPAQANRGSSADHLRSTEPLDLPATPPVLASIGGWASLRTSAELAVRSRWPFMLGLLLVSLFALPGLAGGVTGLQEGSAAALSLLLFTYGLVRGLDGTSRHAAFWKGMGVRPGAWELGAVLVDLAFMGLGFWVWFVLGFDARVGLPAGLSAGLAVYGLGCATRSSAGSEGARFGLVLAMLAVMVVNAIVAFGFSYGHAAVGLAMQVGIVAAAGLISRVLLSGRAPESAAGRGRHRWAWLACALSGLLVVPIQFAQGMPDGTGQASPDGVLLLPERDPMAGRQLWRRGAGGEPERLSARGRFRLVHAGPHGAYVLQRRSLLTAIQAARAAEAETARSGPTPHRRAPWHVGLLTAAGGYVECPAGLDAGDTTFDPDGMGATQTLDDGQLRRLDADGCRLLPTGEVP